MYVASLGKFNIPANDPEWPGTMTYTAEPPVTVRHSMNPWETERQREIWLAEEAAWKTVLPLQAQFRALSGQLRGLMEQYNGLIAELEALLKKKLPLEKMMSPMSALGIQVPFVSQMITQITAMIDSVLGLLTGGFLGGSGKKKKKRAEQLIRRIETIQAQMGHTQQQVIVVVSQIEAAIHAAEGIRASQGVRAQAAIQQSDVAYVARRQLDRHRADVLRERNRQVALLPRHPGGSDVI